MAIKERLLKQLQNIRGGLRAMPPFHSRDLTAMRNALVQARDLCFQGLSGNRFAEYQDTYDGLLLAIDQLATDAPDKEGIVSLCGDLLQHTIAQTQKETAFKKEIFFLPYKASMWDSLESVWKAADEDKEHCIAYVMPIPYADLTSGHTVAEWHCESGMFPKNVPTVDWQTIDLEEMHPDVIFIHNPYDEYNRVTSVESRFYSSKLKDQTDKLVYIPYFVLAEPELDGKSEEEIGKIEEGIEGFILTPAVLNAHQVIVQSEEMRDVYIDVLTRRTDKTDRAFWEKRILGIGSPKFDKVVSTKKEDLDIPEEWLKIIEKPDGSRKKIVFYNTGLSALLHNDEKMLVKMRQVFQTFKEHKDEIALLWRPHPLISATIQSMRPQLSEEYAGIVKQYKEEAWGIYDDSADVDRAVVLSDAYYGDWSSVVQLYQKTGKKIFIQNCTNEHGALREFNWNTHFLDVAHYDGYSYFSESSFNGLFRCKEGDNKAEFLGRFPGEQLLQGDLHRNVVVRGDKLYFIPMNGHGIAVYDCIRGEFRILKVPSMETEFVHFVQCIEQDEKLLLIPINLGTPFALFDLQEEKLSILPDISNQIYGMIPLPARYEMFSVHCAVCTDNYLYLAVSSTNIVLKISLSDYQVEKKVLPIAIHLRYMSRIDGCFYFTAQEHLIASWCEEDNECQTYCIPYKPMENNYPYLKIVPYKGNLYVISGREDRFWKVHLETGAWANLLKNAPKEFERDFQGPLLFLGFKLRKNKLTLYPRAGNGWLILDLETEDFRFGRVKYAEETAKEFHRDLADSIFESGALFYEWDLSLMDYMQYMEMKTEDACREQEDAVRMGEVIYKRTLEEVAAS